MKLFGHPDSGHAYKVRLCLVIAGIDHEYERVDIFAPRDSRSEEFQRNARFHEVPLLIDNDQPYVQSGAILTHLATSRGILGAQDPDLFNRCLEWLFWEANKIGMCLPQLRAAQKFDAMPLAPDARRWLFERYDHDVNLLNAELSDNRRFITGDTITIADLSSCGYLFYAHEAKLAVPAQVTRWLNRISSVPAWQAPHDLL